MIIVTNISERYFEINGKRYAKIYQPLIQGVDSIGIYNVNDTRQQLLGPTQFDEFSIDTVVYGTIAETVAALLPVIFRFNETLTLPSVVWGSITGDIFNQLDLINLLRGKPTENNYATRAEMLADQENQTSGFFQYVEDARSPSEITAEDPIYFAYYEYLGTTAANIADYRLVSSEEYEFPSEIAPYYDQIRGRAIYGSLVDPATIVTLGCAQFTTAHLTSWDDLEVNFEETPNEGFGFYRRLEVVVPATKSFTIPQATTTIGTFIADGTFVNQVDLYFANYPTEGLKIVAVINKGRILGRTYTASVTGSINLDVLQYDYFDLTLTGNTTITLINLPAGDAHINATIEATGNFTLGFTNTITFDADSDDYLGTVANRLSIDIINGGSKIRGFRKQLA